MSSELPDLRDPAAPAEAIRVALALLPHPEGGHYRELWRDRPTSGARGAASTILFLLAAGERSHWHRVDAAELWLWQAGAALQLDLAGPVRHERIALGPGLAAGERLQAVVPAGTWQAAGSLGAWSLVGCVVAPAFHFGGFELAGAGFAPDPRA